MIEKDELFSKERCMLRYWPVMGTSMTELGSREVQYNTIDKNYENFILEVEKLLKENN